MTQEKIYQINTKGMSFEDASEQFSSTVTFKVLTPGHLSPGQYTTVTLAPCMFTLSTDSKGITSINIKHTTYDLSSYGTLAKGVVPFVEYVDLNGVPHIYSTESEKYVPVELSMRYNLAPVDGQTQRGYFFLETKETHIQSVSFSAVQSDPSLQEITVICKTSEIKTGNMLL